MELEANPPEVVVEEEPRYLRLQRPVEIKRRKFGKRARTLTKRVAVVGTGVLAGGWLLYVTAHFLLDSPRAALLHPSQIELSGNHHVSRKAVLEVFAVDRGRSLLQIPLEQRRKRLEQIPWVDQAVVRRVLPNRVQVGLVERTPVAFLRTGTELALVDVHGVILDRPLGGNFQFPVVTGIFEETPLEQRERRMNLLVEFLHDVDLARSGSSAQVSEVDLTDSTDLRATLAGLPELRGHGPVLVHFGDGDFRNKFRLLLDNFAQWRTAAGRLDSVDLRFDREVVVNPERPLTAARNNKSGAKAR